jgi:hypothetical protein
MKRIVTHVVMDDRVLAAQQVDRSIDRTQVTIKAEIRTTGWVWRNGSPCWKPMDALHYDNAVKA